MCGVAYKPSATVVSSSSVSMDELYTFSKFNLDSSSELISVREDCARVISLLSTKAVKVGSTALVVEDQG